MVRTVQTAETEKMARRGVLALTVLLAQLAIRVEKGAPASPVQQVSPECAVIVVHVEDPVLTAPRARLDLQVLLATLAPLALMGNPALPVP